MQTSLILANVSKHIDLQADESDFFLSLLKEKRVKRKQHLLRENDVCLQSVFVNTGCLRGYTLDKNGYEHILQFAPPGWWIADMYSMLTRQPGELFIEALEDTEVLLLHIDDRDRLMREVPKFERFFRIIIENSLITFRQRLMENLGLPARDRYLLFCKRYPTLIERLPQKQIAAYIGVTPEFLSKMRAEMLRAR
ncbi:MAG: Crp/Fnr family transcriptional regulator [Saprospiraceae bacterium]|nr:Crp/Fnr family transcriptional regulator [Saprospiraceae bacterium]